MIAENKKMILIVDDEEDLRDGMSFQFKNRGYDVVAALDGLEALEKLKTIKPDLIIVDLNMPRMNGLEFCEKISDGNGRFLHPVIVLTTQANTKRYFLQFEVEAFFYKPFEVDDLIMEAERIIEKTKKHEKTMDIREKYLREYKLLAKKKKKPAAKQNVSQDLQ